MVNTGLKHGGMWEYEENHEEKGRANSKEEGMKIDIETNPTLKIYEGFMRYMWTERGGNAKC